MCCVMLLNSVAQFIALQWQNISNIHGIIEKLN